MLEHYFYYLLDQNYSKISCSLLRFLGHNSEPKTVFPGLAIYRQIRDFGLLFGDGKFELAIYRQSPKFRDF